MSRHLLTTGPGARQMVFASDGGLPVPLYVPELIKGGYDWGLDFAEGWYRDGEIIRRDALALPGATSYRAGECWDLDAKGRLRFFDDHQPIILPGLGALFYGEVTNELPESNNLLSVWTHLNLQFQIAGEPSPLAGKPVWRVSKDGERKGYAVNRVSKVAAAQQRVGVLLIKSGLGDFGALRFQGQYPARAEVIVDMRDGSVYDSWESDGFSIEKVGIDAVQGGWWLIHVEYTTDDFSSVATVFSFSKSGVFVDREDTDAEAWGYYAHAHSSQGWGRVPIIPTEGAAASITAQELVYDSPITEGEDFVLWIEAEPFAFSGTENQYLVRVDDGSDVNRIMIYIRSNKSLAFYTRTEGGDAVSVLDPPEIGDQVTLVLSRQSGAFTFGVRQAGSFTWQAGGAIFPAGLSDLRVGGGASGSLPALSDIERVMFRRGTFSQAEIEALVEGSSS